MQEAWIRVAALSDFTVSTSVDMEGSPVALFKTDRGVYALDDICSHEYSRLSEGDVWDEEVYCPKHGSRFSLRDGSVTGLPATRPVRSWQVRVEAGEIWIASQPAQR